jgi:hypothetical protein
MVNIIFQFISGIAATITVELIDLPNVPFYHQIYNDEYKTLFPRFKEFCRHELLSQGNRPNQRKLIKKLCLNEMTCISLDTASYIVRLLLSSE